MASNVDRLHEAGVFNRDSLSDEEKQKVNGLSDDEVQQLINIKDKLGTKDSPGPDFTVPF